LWYNVRNIGVTPRDNDKKKEKTTGLAIEEFQGLATAANRIHGDKTIQCGKFTLFFRRQPEQVDIRYMGMGNDGIRLEDFKDAQIFAPEMMAGCVTDLLKNLPHSVNISGPARVFRMAGNADETVFGYRARRPCPPPLFDEPSMGQVMMDMGWIDQGKQHIDI
jgi:hypothetical protein